MKRLFKYTEQIGRAVTLAGLIWAGLIWIVGLWRVPAILPDAFASLDRAILVTLVGLFLISLSKTVMAKPAQGAGKPKRPKMPKPPKVDKSGLDPVLERRLNALSRQSQKPPIRRAA